MQSRAENRIRVHARTRIDEAHRNRKQRADKKVDVKPTVSLILKRELRDFSELCEEPIKDIAERLCVEGLRSQLIITELRKWFRRNFYGVGTVVFGDVERPRLQVKYEGETSKVSTRFTAEHCEQLKALAHALDITPTSAAAVLIRVTTKNSAFMRQFVDTLDVDGERKKQLYRFFG